jgi:prevent-host-death family protein
MRSISIGELCAEIDSVLEAVESGQPFIITRNGEAVARLEPTVGVTAAAFTAAIRRTPVDADWAAELAASRDGLAARDPWNAK